MSNKIITEPRWFKELKELTPQARLKLVEIVLENTRRCGNLNDKVNPLCDRLVRDLKSNYDFVGFSPSVAYLKGKGGDPKAIYVHPWGMTTLIFKHKHLPALVHVNALMMKDDLALAKIPENRGVFDGISAEGIVG